MSKIDRQILAMNACSQAINKLVACRQSLDMQNLLQLAVQYGRPCKLTSVELMPFLVRLMKQMRQQKLNHIWIYKNEFNKSNAKFSNG